MGDRGIDLLLPAACAYHLMDKFSLERSHPENVIYAQSRSDPELKVMVARQCELEDRQVDVIRSRMEYIRDRYIGERQGGK